MIDSIAIFGVTDGSSCQSVKRLRRAFSQASIEPADGVVEERVVMSLTVDGGLERGGGGVVYGGCGG